MVADRAIEEGLEERHSRQAASKKSTTHSESKAGTSALQLECQRNNGRKVPEMFAEKAD